MKYANCSECEKKGLPSGYCTVGMEGNKVFIRCSTCDKLVLTLVLTEKEGEKEYENKIGT